MHDVERLANAMHIMKCWNNHDKLVEALTASVKLNNELIEEYINTGRNKMQNPVAVMAARVLAAVKGE